jgi:DNA gyrase subunit A
MEIGLVRKVDIDAEMQQAYLDYAMSVIVARALPDARDGLKPVHRRILYAMWDMGLRGDSSYKKSARIVGEVLGKYHPHGDMAVYDAMARLAQDFSLRYPLVDGQGNFGSVDGDPPAAMRYTEARLAAPALDILADIQKETVDFAPNFDGSLEEPQVLPSALPNLLVNGATGIAVGMATSIPPHNLREVCAAARLLLNRWDELDEVTVADLMAHIQGPDFPTGGILLTEALTEGGENGLAAAYGSGRGRVTVQARAHLEELERGRSRIIVTELPYLTNKASLIERIANLTREGRIEGIVDLRDESDRTGMRILIELNKNVEPEAILRDLFRLTPMQSTFSMIMLALVDGEPRLLSLKTALRVYLEHRLEIVRRRAEFELRRAEARAHILEGLRVALANLDAIIALIRKAPDVETARARLIKTYKLSEIQAQAILDMPLRRLAALERKKIEEEWKALQVEIKGLKTLLKSPARQRETVAAELEVVEAAYGDERRTQIVERGLGADRRALLTASDLASDAPVWVGVDEAGQLWSAPEAPALHTRLSVQAPGRATLIAAAASGMAAAVAVHTLPRTPTDLHRATALAKGEEVAALVVVPPKNGDPAPGEPQFLATVSRLGLVKKSALSELPGPAAAPFLLAKINPGDEIVTAVVTGGADELVLVSEGGMAIRFGEDEVRPMGLAAAGVQGMRLKEGDAAAAALAIPPQTDGEIVLRSLAGGDHRLKLAKLPRQRRSGQGVIAWKLSTRGKNAGPIGEAQFLPKGGATAAKPSAKPKAAAKKRRGG